MDATNIRKYKLPIVFLEGTSFGIVNIEVGNVSRDVITQYTGLKNIFRNSQLDLGIIIRD